MDENYRQLEAASQPQTLVLMGDFNCPDVCWSSSTANHKQSRRFLESVDNFLTQMVKGPTRNSVLLNLIITNGEGLVGHAKDEGTLGCSHHKIVEFGIR